MVRSSVNDGTCYKAHLNQNSATTPRRLVSMTNVDDQPRYRQPTRLKRENWDLDCFFEHSESIWRWPDGRWHCDITWAGLAEFFGFSE